MYGYNFGGPFVNTGMAYGPMMGGINSRIANTFAAPMMRGAGSLGSLGGLGSLRGASSLGGGLRGGLFSIVKGVNWSGLLNNASKTLGVVNQAIPIVKQVGPMMNNMKSMLKIASVFKDETDTIPQKKESTVSTSKIDSTTAPETISENNQKIELQSNDNEPNFFL